MSHSNDYPHETADIAGRIGRDSVERMIADGIG